MQKASVQYFDEIPADLRLQDLDWLRTVEVHECIDSTNSRAHDLFHSLQTCPGEMHLVCADQQTAGRGRRQRHWISPARSNIYASFGVSFGAELDISGLSLVVGMCLQRMLMDQFALFSMVKWPNDLVCGDRKLAGVLIEAFQGDGLWRLVIGIGLNVNMRGPVDAIDQPWTSLELEAGHRFSRSLILQAIAKALAADLDAFARHGWGWFAPNWPHVDWLLNQRISISGLDMAVEGIAAGVDNTGCLLVKSKQVTHRVVAGEIQLNSTGHMNKEV